jgi:flavin reductase (DIM6/NTAB) family NADH-FMN oxidoreductase RutF
VLRTSPSLGLSVLSDAQGAACEALAGDREERFATLAWFATETGAILLEGAVLWLVGSISQELPAGDHRIVVLQLDALGSEAPREPLVFHAGRFRRLAVGHWKHQDRGGPEAL